MKLPKSKIGLTFPILYLLGSIFLIITQGLFGENFIVLILGLPWSFGTILLGFTATNTVFLYTLFLMPILFNIIILYWIGMGIQKLFFNRHPNTNPSSTSI